MRRTMDEKIFYFLKPGLYSRTVKELETVEEKVCWLLEKFEKLRNKDRLLIFYYWNMVDGYTGELKESVIMNLTSSETVRRVRAKIQNKYNLFLPTDDDVVLARNIKQDAVRDWAVSQRLLQEETSLGVLR